jgi:hypothetical protein
MAGRRRAAALILAGAVLVHGCATAAKPVVYGPIGDEQAYGYRDRENPDGGHTVLVTVPAGFPASEARAWFDRRAGELCPGGVERTNVFRAQANEYTMRNYGGPPSAASRIFTTSELEGYVYCKAQASAAAG